MGPGAKERLGYIVHFTPESVLSTPKYRQWMSSFDDCVHLVCNGSGTPTPMSDGPYNNQHMLTKLDPVVFPELYPFDFVGKITQVRFLRCC